MNSKKIIYVILGVLIIGGTIYAYQKNENKNKDEILNKPLNEIVSLPQDERSKYLEIQLKELDRESKNINNQTSSGDIYNIRIRLAEVQLELGKYDEAKNTLNSIPVDKMGNSRTNLDYGRAYLGLKDVSQAKDFLRKSLDQDDTNTRAWVFYIEANNNLPNEQLNTLYREAIVKTKSGLDIMISYARFSERIGDKATAIAAWETAINHNPEKESEYRAEIDRLKQ